MASKINKYKLKGTETRADILDKIGGSGGGARPTSFSPRNKKKKAAGRTKAPEPRKRGGGVGMEPRVRTESGAIIKLSPKQSKRLSKADLADIMKTARMPSKMKVTKAKRPVVTGKDVGAAAVASAAAGAYVAGRAVKKKEPAKLKKRSKKYMTRQFSDGTSEPYKVIKGSQFINQ